MTRRIFGLFLLGLALLGALAPALASACGLPLQARIPAEQALIIHAAGRQQIITTVHLEDVQGRAAVVFPVPAVPEVDQPPGGADLFAYLEEATKPEERVVRRVVWGRQAPAGDAQPRALEVLGRERIGGYDVARLAADDPQALERWLDANGYSMPPGAQPILSAYVAEGWKFVAVKLAAATAGGSLDPLRLSFASPSIIYPMRLGALAEQPLNVQIYVLADRRVTLEGLETLYAGPTAQLDPPPPPALAGLFAAAPYLTHAGATALDPRSISADIVAVPAPDNQPYRATRTVYRTVPAAQAYGLALAILCLVVVNLFSVAIALAFKKRFDAMNPDKK